MARSKGEGGLVYSTGKETMASLLEGITLGSEEETLSPGEQQLHVHMERKGRKGKTVTLITGFVGRSSDLEELQSEYPDVPHYDSEDGTRHKIPAAWLIQQVGMKGAL